VVGEENRFKYLDDLCFLLSSSSSEESDRSDNLDFLFFRFGSSSRSSDEDESSTFSFLLFFRRSTSDSDSLRLLLLLLVFFSRLESLMNSCSDEALSSVSVSLRFFRLGYLFFSSSVSVVSCLRFFDLGLSSAAESPSSAANESSIDVPNAGS